MHAPITLTFTLAGLLKGVFSLLGIVALVYIILVLKEIFSILKSSREFYNKNSEEIDTIVKDGSVIIHKVGVLAENIPDEPLSILGDFKGSFAIVQTIISFVLGLFTKSKDN